MVSARRIGKRDIDKLQPGHTIWDSEVAGFGARRQVGAVSYVLFYRTAPTAVVHDRAPWFSVDT